MSSRMNIHVHTKSLLMWSDYAIRDFVEGVPPSKQAFSSPEKAWLRGTISTTVYIYIFKKCLVKENDTSNTKSESKETYTEINNNTEINTKRKAGQKSGTTKLVRKADH